ncbi:MAG: hypothetical protein ACC656_12505, partial [Candidatus Heimdallarchaeota archaeon]
MKSIKHFILSVSLLFLLSVSLGTAHGNEDGNGSGHMNSDTVMKMDHDGFEGYSKHMKINGTIVVTDSVKLTISAEPTEEMRARMNDHMSSQSGMMAYSNMMTISITKLVEFVDATANGYSEDDLLVSEFVMNETTMNPVEIQTNADNSTFIINSKSNVINISVEMLSENNSPYAFKWSLGINYPFMQNDTRIAVLHEMDSPNMADMMSGMDQMANQGFVSNMMTDNNENLPMFFSWDENYVVDGETKEVSANLEKNIFSLSFDQGAEIIYDPQLGFNPQDIRSVDNLLGNIGLDQFWQTVKSPTSLGIVLGVL